MRCHDVVVVCAPLSEKQGTADPLGGKSEGISTQLQAFPNMKVPYPEPTEQEFELCVLGFFSFRAKETAQLTGFKEKYHR